VSVVVVDDDDNDDDDDNNNNNNNNAGYAHNMKKTIDHITSECPVLAKSDYSTRHDTACAHFYYSKQNPRR
jgi:hypothetical protein